MPPDDKKDDDKPPSESQSKSGGTKSNAPAPRAMSNAQLVKRMMAYLGPVKGMAALCCLMIIFSALIDINVVRISAGTINYVANQLKDPTRIGGGSEPFIASLRHKPMSHVLALVTVLGALVLTNGVLGFLKQVANMKFSMDMVFHMRSAVYDRLQRVGFTFHDEHSSGQLINRSLSDLQNIRMFVNTALLTTVEILAYVIAYNGLIIWLNPMVGLIALIPIPLWLWYIMYFSRKMQPIQKALMESGDDMMTVLTENIAGVYVVKAFATEKTEIIKYDQKTSIYFKRVMETIAWWKDFVPVIQGIASASHLSLFAVGCVLVIRGYMVVGSLLVLGTAMGQILGKLQLVDQINQSYQRAVVSAKRFFEVIDAPSAAPEHNQAKPLPKGPGAVEYSFVTFGYDPKKPVLQDIAFDVPGGSVVALVGPTGAGKTTMMNLLTRFYDPQQGQILIDGVNIKNATLDSLRSSIGFVFQETFLFSDTVANNIRYGHLKASQGDVEAAARIAQAHDFIMELPRGYETMLGERGATLSGGQRQRLAIARAIVSNPRILILDDALAAVDPNTEQMIARALDLVMVDRTVFIIAHRLSTVKASDLVIVLENGRITQAGTHKELLRQEGHYKHIAKVQLSYQEAEVQGIAEKRAAKEAAKV